MIFLKKFTKKDYSCIARELRHPTACGTFRTPPARETAKEKCEPNYDRTMILPLPYTQGFLKVGALLLKVYKSNRQEHKA